ncbi:MAG: GntR family transcriptional regulator [Nocardioidaceae bacterium]|nr:GntR family transcriptional regulator [Nocardioidaceae bacterium]
MTSTGRYIEPLVRESTPSIIADKLRNAIGSGELRAGQQLGEAELARELGVSRGPLREGMQRLTQEGLLMSIRNRGLFVIEMTPENVRDMYVARSAVERAAGAQIFVHDPVAAGDALLALTDQMAQSAARRDIAAVSESDIEFHQLLVSLAKSPRLTRIHKTLLTETRMCIHALEETYRYSDVRVTEHHGIAAAFTASDPVLTDERLVAHMEDALVRLANGASPLRGFA